MGAEKFRVSLKALFAGRLLRRVWEITKFLLSSGTGSAADMCIYTALILWTDLRFLTAFTIGRVTGGVINFTINKFLVFKRGNNSLRAIATDFLKFAVWWLFLYFCSRGIMEFFVNALGVSIIMANPLTNILLWVFGYIIQKFVIFRRVPVPNITDDAQDTGEEKSGAPGRG